MSIKTQKPPKTSRGVRITLDEDLSQAIRACGGVVNLGKLKDEVTTYVNGSMGPEKIKVLARGLVDKALEGSSPSS